MLKLRAVLISVKLPWKSIYADEQTAARKRKASKSFNVNNVNILTLC